MRKGQFNTSILPSSLVRGCLLVIILLFRTVANLQALSPDVPLTQLIREQWQTERGLPQNTVYDLLQDRNGYLWLGTEGGLVRFDGIQFDVYDKEYFQGNFHNFVYRILEAKDGVLWVGTRGGGVFEVCGEEVKLCLSTKIGLSNDQVHALAQTEDGAIWIGTREGLNRYHQGKIQQFTTRDGLPSDFVTALHADGQKVWFGTDRAEFGSFDGQTFTVYGNEEFILRSEVQSIVTDKDGALWVGLDGDGLYRFQDGKFERKIVLPDKILQNIQRLYVDRSNALWVATQFDGIVRIKGSSLEPLRREGGLSQNFVVSFLEDREGSLWIGTAFGGLNRLREGLIKTIGAPEGLHGERTTSLAEDQQGGVYIGTYQNGLYRYFRGRTAPFDLTALELPSIRALLAGRDGTVWVGTGGAGLFQIANETQRRYKKKDGLLEDDINTLFEDSAGNLWVGFQREGVSRRDARTGEFVHFTDSLLKTFIRGIQEDSNGSILVGTQSSGLIQVKDGKVSQAIPAQVTGAVRAMAPALSGGIWIATRDEGILLYGDGNYRVFNSSSGLRQEQLFSICEASGFLWFASSAGIERVKVDELLQMTEKKPLRTLQVFNETDGMRTSQPNANGSPGAFRSSDGKVWFATERGVCVLDPAREEKAEPAEVLIKKVLVDGQAVDWNRGLRLRPGANRISIHYATPVLGIPSRVRYRVELKGAPREPVYTGFRREAVFHNLAPGEYLFSVQASNEFGEWSEIPATVAIIQAPYLYQRAWFICGLVLAGVAGLRTVFAWRTKSMKQQKAELERLVAQRTEQLTLEVEQRKDAQNNLRQLNEELEERVSERTGELKKASRKMQLELVEREKAEAALSASESRLRRVVESGMVGILFWDIKGGINQANDAFLDMVGYSRAELEAGALRWDKITPPEFLAHDRKALEAIRLNGVCEPFEKEYLHKEGYRVPVFVGGAAFSESHEEGVCFVLDITRRKKAEQEIHQLNLGLESRVQERTAELARINEKLEREVNARKKAAVALAAFSQLGKKLQPSRTEKEAARIISETARALLGWDACALDLYNANERLVRVFEDPAAPSQLERYGSSISVPIKYEERTIGILTLHKAAAGAFTNADSSTLQSLGAYASGALQRIHTEAARRESERRFQAFMNNTPAMAWLKDSQFRYIYANQTFVQKLPAAVAPVEGKSDYDLWPKKTAFKLRTNDEQTLALNRTVQGYENVPSANGANQTWLVFKFPLLSGDGQQLVGGMAVDVTEQKRAEDALHKLPQKILEAQESERRRVARELHDSVQQVLHSIIFRVQHAERLMASGSDRWEESLKRTRELLNSAIEEVGRIGRNLRPSELDDIGLIAALQPIIREFSTRTAVDVLFESATYHNAVSKLTELTLYRIVQEALTNMEKHAGATAVTIQVGCDETYATLHIKDNGRGFELASSPATRSGMGLMNMRERASSVGGLFSIKTSPGTGVEISVYLPLAVSPTSEL